MGPIESTCHNTAREVRARLYAPSRVSAPIKIKDVLGIALYSSGARTIKRVSYIARLEPPPLRADFREPENVWIIDNPLTCKIVQCVSERLSVSPDRIIGRSRVARIIYAKHLSIYLLQIIGGYSTPQIGKVFDRDHTTVLSSLRKIRRLVATSDTAKADADHCLSVVR